MKLFSSSTRNLQCLIWALLALAGLVHSAPTSSAPAVVPTDKIPEQPSQPQPQPQTPLVTTVVTRSIATTVIAATATTTTISSPTVTTPDSKPVCIPDTQIPGNLVCADSTLYCETTSGTCVAKLANNLPCLDGSQCGTGYCLNSICADAPNNATNGTSSLDGSGSSGGGNTGVKVGIVAGIVVGIMCAIGIAFWVFNYLQRRRTNNGSRSSIIRPPKMRSTEPVYPFSGRAAAFSNNSPPQTLPPAPLEHGHTRIGSMGDPTQRRTSFYSNGTAFINGPNNNYNALDESKNNVSMSRGTPVLNNNNDNGQMPPQPYNNSSYHPTTLSKDWDLSNNRHPAIGPQQGKKLRNNLHEAAKAIHEQENKLKGGAVATTNTQKLNQDSARRDSAILPGDDEIVHSTTDSLYLGVGADALVEPVDYTSPTGNGRYKMSSMYSTFSRDSIIFANMPEMPEMPPLTAFNFGGITSSTSASPKSSPPSATSNTPKIPSHNHTLSKDSLASLNKVPRASVYTLHAPIFKSYQSSPEHQRNMSSSSLRSQITHQRNMSQTSQSSVLRHHRDFSNSSQVLNPSPLGPGHSRNVSEASKLSSTSSKYSQSSSVYSSANSDSDTSATSKVTVSPTFGFSENNTKSSMITSNNNIANIDDNNNSLLTKPYNVDRESTASSLSDLTSSASDVEYDYVVPEMSTIEERMAEDELYAMSHSSTYSMRTSELDLDQDLDAIRQFAEDAWGMLNGGIDTSDSSATSNQNGTFSTKTLSRSTSHLSKSSTESTATITGRAPLNGSNINYGLPIVEDDEDPDYRFY
ncbi:5876_t:CDS:2 [Ambispora gerdemannii]|uniref:5876_t:CDS:1 n=1 Tax=Ambispora gerdemannii TaxID=144530 RepID=A0A9N9A408_9GLOM|nr:5876_t:CDS:2 [Ambispora gerdemannii]